MSLKSSILKHKTLYGGLIVTAVLVVGVLEVTNVTHFFHDKKIETASEYTKGETQDNDSANTSESNSSSADKPSKTTVEVGDTELITPSGQFVSNHRPGQDGSPTTEQSVCNTTPGASCTISFTKGSTTKSLPVKVADAGGSAYWQWSPGDVGLTAGLWTVSATAKLNDKSAKGTDAMQLEIMQ